jgi:hypothetical protein
MISLIYDILDNMKENDREPIGKTEIHMLYKILLSS